MDNKYRDGLHEEWRNIELSQKGLLDDIEQLEHHAHIRHGAIYEEYVDKRLHTMRLIQMIDENGRQLPSVCHAIR